MRSAGLVFRQLGAMGPRLKVWHTRGRSADHKSIVLRGWRRIVPNWEVASASVELQD